MNGTVLNNGHGPVLIEDLRQHQVEGTSSTLRQLSTVVHPLSRRNKILGMVAIFMVIVNSAIMCFIVLHPSHFPDTEGVLILLWTKRFLEYERYSRLCFSNKLYTVVLSLCSTLRLWILKGSNTFLCLSIL